MIEVSYWNGNKVFNDDLKCTLKTRMTLPFDGWSMMVDGKKLLIDDASPTVIWEAIKNTLELVCQTAIDCMHRSPQTRLETQAQLSRISRAVQLLYAGKCEPEVEKVCKLHRESDSSRKLMWTEHWTLVCLINGCSSRPLVSLDSYLLIRTTRSTTYYNWYIQTRAYNKKLEESLRRIDTKLDTVIYGIDAVHLKFGCQTYKRIVTEAAGIDAKEVGRRIGPGYGSRRNTMWFLFVHIWVKQAATYVHTIRDRHATKMDYALQRKRAIFRLNVQRTWQCTPHHLIRVTQ